MFKMPRQKYRMPEAEVPTSSESESEDQDEPGAACRFVEAHRNQGAAVFSDSLLRGAKAVLEAEPTVKEVNIHGGATADQVLDNARTYLDDHPGSFLIIICAGSNNIFERRDYSVPPPYEFTEQEAADYSHTVNSYLEAKRSEFVVDAARRQCEVAFCTVPSRNNLHKGNIQSFLRANALIRKSNLERSIPTPDIDTLISRYRVVNDREMFYHARSSRLRPDGIHPKPETAVKWGKEILKLVVPLC